MLAPSAAVFAAFVFYPLIRSIQLSLYRTSPFGGEGIFAGLDQYVELFASPAFWNSLRTTGLFVLMTVPAGMAAGLALALLSAGSLRGAGIFRTAFSVTIGVSVATAAVIFLLFYNPSIGLLNLLLYAVGLPQVGWLTDPNWALPSIAVMTVWMNLGFNYLVLTSGLSAIPEELFEAARIDGAGPWTVVRQITLPLLSPSIFFLLVVSTLGAFQAFGQFNILTRGGPAGSTNVIVNSIYQEAFRNYQYGKASAIALVLFAIMLVLTLLQFRYVESRVHYR